MFIDLYFDGWVDFLNDFLLFNLILWVWIKFIWFNLKVCCEIFKILFWGLEV